MSSPVIIGDKRKRTGADNPLYRGGKSHDGNGYITFTSGPHKWQREHRVVMETALGRNLLPDEVVHHINGDRTDNRLENLSVETRASHNREHGKGRMWTCKCGKEKWYPPSYTSKNYKCRACWIADGGNKCNP